MLVEPPARNDICLMDDLESCLVNLQDGLQQKVDHSCEEKLKEYGRGIGSGPVH